MPFMYSFCFCCSVRLGSIVVGILSLIQSSICTIIGLIWVNQTSENARKYLQTITEDVNLIFLTRLFNEIKNDPELFSWLFLLFAVCHIITCTLEIYGSYKLAVKMLYPYLVAEMIRLVFLLSAHIFGMMLIKENILELGILIYSTLTGFFLLLYLFYGWACVLSLSQCLQQIGGQLKSTNDRPSTLSVRVNRLSDMKIINYDNFLLPTISNAIGGQDFPSSSFCVTHRNTSLITPYYR